MTEIDCTFERQIEYENKFSCSDCGVYACRSKNEEKYPSFCLTKQADQALLSEVVDIYKSDELVRRIANTSACIEGEFYCKYTRVEETVEFIKRMGYKKVGIATCVGLIKETGIFVKILKAHGIETYTACCKIGAVEKDVIGVSDEKKLGKGQVYESMCNPIMQAKALAAERVEFNVVIGLCVGHDSLFFKYAEAPTTVLISKDRVLCHNPAAAIYAATTGYSRFKEELGK